MLYYVTHENHANTVKRLIKGASGALRFVRPISYERLFYDRRAPIGHYIFTDFDRLSSYEIEIASTLSDALRAYSPALKIYNDPKYVLERYALLKKLEREGLNRFTVTRLDAHDVPPRYPVFIRSEDDCRNPDTDLLFSESELIEAIDRLRAIGRTPKRRIAVGFCAQKDSKGFYRKYGAFNICGTIVPQHILRGENWLVKNRRSEWDEKFVAEELAYIHDNPHRAELKRVFDIANIDFGRADYTIVDGAIQIFEINTNPSFPNLNKTSDARAERREILRQGLVGTLVSLDTPLPGGRPIRFSPPKPYFHRIRPPQRTIIPNLIRRLYKLI